MVVVGYCMAEPSGHRGEEGQMWAEGQTDMQRQCRGLGWRCDPLTAVMLKESVSQTELLGVIGAVKKRGVSDGEDKGHHGGTQ